MSRVNRGRWRSQAGHLDAATAMRDSAGSALADDGDASAGAVENAALAAAVADSESDDGDAGVEPLLFSFQRTALADSKLVRRARLRRTSRR